MKANEKRLLRFLEGIDKNFIIPVYQRNYDWQIAQCEQLFSDLKQIITHAHQSHFLGSIVSIYSDDGDQQYLIIDGQQRLTTVSLLLLAIHNHINSSEEEVSRINKDQIRDEYLVNKYSEDSKKIKLKPIKNDEKAFNKLFSGQSHEFIKESNVTRNYEYFSKKIKEDTTISVDQLFNALHQLVIVDIELKSGEDDPQLIFESLNSTGLNLTQSDLVRNFILMKENAATQEKYYEDYWQKIEYLTSYSVDSFIRDYLTYEERNIPNKDKVYSSFKTYVNRIQANKESKSTKDILEELLRFSRYYNQIITQNHPNNLIVKYLKDISELEISVSHPFLLQLFNDCENKKIIDEQEVVNCLKIIISYCFRRTVCNLPTNALNKIFSQIGKDVYKHINCGKSYSEILNIILTSKSGVARYPDNEEFRENFVHKNIGDTKRKNQLYLLLSLENFDNKEEIYSIELSIEHIMPQTLSKEWIKSLGKNYEELHSKYVSTIGNLTLTGYNSKLSNKPFSFKLNMDNGYKQSRLKLNKFLTKYEEWGEDQIKERAMELFNIAKKIWKYERTQGFDDEVDNIISIYDENDFTGTNVKYLVFDGERINCSTWKDLTVNSIKRLFELDRSLMKNLSDDEYFSNKLRYSPKEMRTPEKISEGIFLESHTNTRQKIDLLRKLMDQYRLDEDDLRVCIEI